MKITKTMVMEWLMIFVGTAIIAVSVYFFMMPSHLTIGSASALAIIIIK